MHNYPIMRSISKENEKCTDVCMTAGNIESAASDIVVIVAFTYSLLVLSDVPLLGLPS